MKPFGYEQFLQSSNPLARLFGPWIGELHFGIRVRARYLKKALRELEAPGGQNILDAGCGLGQTSFQLRKLLPQARILGIDINDRNVRHCSEISAKLGCRDIRFLQGDISSSIPERDCDLIVCCDVIEHIEEWRKVLDNLAACLAPGGILILHTPRKSRFQGPAFGFRRFIKRSDHGEHEIGEVHVHEEGFGEEDFSYLEKLGLQHSTSVTFGAWTMWLHTFFELYRGRSRIFHAALTPLLSMLAKPEELFPLTDGGGLLVIAHKPRRP